jgi:Holliday junction resolvase RusA-like endonuclease
MPLYIELNGKKRHINLNNYRNWHRFLSNNIKQNYSDLACAKLRLHKNKQYQKIKLEFTYYKPTKAKRDRANILCVTEKFFCDAMTKVGMIPDDNDDHIKSSFYKSGGLDRENPRVEIKIILL